jgi:hypothetical protein
MLGDESGPIVIGRGWERNELPFKFGEFDDNRSPIIIGFAYPESHKFYGKSYPGITRDLQKEYNAEINQHREAVARKLRPTTYINRDANVDLMSLVNRRIGGYVQGDGPAGNSITELPTMDPTVVSLRALSRIDQDYAENGLPPNLLGTPTTESTATGQTQQLSNANKKIAFVVRNLAFTAFLPAFRYLLRLEQLYVSDEFVNKVTGRVLGFVVGDDGFPPRESIQGDFDLKINLGINKQAQLNKLLLIQDRINQTNAMTAQLVQFGVVDPSQVQFLNPSMIFDRLLPLLGERNADELKIQATPPPQQQNVPGVASQPRNVLDVSDAVGQSNPEDGLNVIG